METKTIIVKYALPRKVIIANKEVFTSISKTGILRIPDTILSAIDFFKENVSYKYIELTYQEDFLQEFYFKCYEIESKNTFKILRYEKAIIINLKGFLTRIGHKPWMFTNPYKYEISKVNEDTYKATLKV